VTAYPDGGYELLLPVSPEAPPNLPSKLVGVLTAAKGWKADGSQHGLRVETEFRSPAASGAGPSRPGTADRNAPAVRANDTPTSDVGLLVTLGLALLGGLILNLMPCVFPVLGLKVLGFVEQSGTQRRSVVAHGLMFTAGVLLSFWALAGLLAALRAAGTDLGWGFQLQSPVFVFALTVVMLAFGLNLSGVFEFGVHVTGLGSGLQTKSGPAGSFFAGVLATVVATPCSAPFLAPALGAALALPVTQSFVVFTVIAIGLSAPYLMLSIFPGAVRWLPRPGAWMETFKQLMAFPLYATAAYLVWVLAGQLSEGGLLAALLGLTLVAMAVWIYGRWNAPGASPARARFGLAAGVILLALGLMTGWPRAAAPTEVTWEKWSPQALAQLRAQGRYIYVDFTARWCATCQANKKLVFGSQDVQRAFSTKHIATLKADWTNSDPEITAELARFGRSAVPFNLLYTPGNSEPVELPALITPAFVLELVNGN